MQFLKHLFPQTIDADLQVVFEQGTPMRPCNFPHAGKALSSLRSCDSPFQALLYSANIVGIPNFITIKTALAAVRVPTRAL